MKIVHLFPTLMGTYGDLGNTLVLKYILKANKYNPKIVFVNPGDKIPTDANLYILGGGEDLGQEFVSNALKKGDFLKKILKNENAFLFCVCAGMQIIGETYEVLDNKKIDGLGLLSIRTKRLEKRAVGELLVKSSKFGILTGYENHGGGTILNEYIEPLGTVEKGIGNGFDQLNEGFITNNIIGTYMHGPVLTRNPKLLKYIVKKSLNVDIKNFNTEYIGKLRNERFKYLNFKN